MRVCKFDFRLRCYHSSCDLFNCNSGNVSVCPLFRGGSMSASRRVAPVRVSVKGGS